MAPMPTALTTKFSLALVIIGPAYWVFLTQVGVSRVAVYWMVIIDVHLHCCRAYDFAHGHWR